MKKLSFIICLVLVFTLAFASVGVSAKTVKKSGWYSAAAVKKASYQGLPGVKKFKIRGNKLITYGRFYKGFKKLKAQKRVFKLSSRCKYVFTAVPSTYDKKVSKHTLFNKLRKTMKRNITAEGIYIHVKGGKVVRINYGQF